MISPEISKKTKKMWRSNISKTAGSKAGRSPVVQTIAVAAQQTHKNKKKKSA